MEPELLFSKLKEKLLAAGFNLVGRVRTKDYSESAKLEKGNLKKYMPLFC